MRVVGQAFCAARGDDVTGFNQVGVVRQFQGEAGILFDQKNADMSLAADAFDDGEDAFHDARRQPE